MHSENPNPSRRDIGLDIIAVVHVLAAILPTAAIVCLYNPGDEIKVLPWAILTILLLAIAWGLRRRAAWACVLTLVIHWPVFVGALGLHLCMFYMFLFSVHFHPGAYLGVGVVHTLPILMVSVGTLWWLQWRFIGKLKMHHIIAVVHVLAAILLAVATVGLYNPGDQHEALPWVLLAMLLLAMARGLWRQAAWARGLALLIHWPAFVGAAVLLPLCLCIIFLIPARGIAMGRAYAVFGVIGLLPVLLVSGCTLWFLRRQKVREDKLLREPRLKENEN